MKCDGYEVVIKWMLNINVVLKMHINTLWSAL